MHTHTHTHIYKHDLLHSANEFHSSFSECGRHFALENHWELFFFKFLHYYEVPSLPEKTLAHCGHCCAQNSPGSAPFTQHQII